MGFDALEIGIRIWKYTIISMKSCYKLVCDHLILLGLLCFLFLFSRSFPLLFSIFVYFSPVLVCTAVLLGTLLSFGQPYVPEIDYEHKRLPHVNDITVLKKSVVLGIDSVVVHRDETESIAVENFIENRNIVFEKSDEKGDSAELKNEYLDDNAPLIGVISRGIDFEKRVNEKLEGVSDSEHEHEESRNGNEYVDDESQYSLLPKPDNENFESMDHSSWQKIENHNEDHHDDVENDDDDDDHDESSSNSESDISGSSSPDASMTDIMPMLDELHPLLDMEAPQPAYVDESDAKSDTDTVKEEDDEDEDEDEDEEVEEQNDKQIGHESAITWTEDDQKNLMDLGTSEIERNQRLENLILRRARKNSRLLNEKNLIDLDSTDPPFMTPIVTTRGNPFDSIYDSYDDMLIPGSAPSVMLPGRNPFDIPYDSTEEKPNLLSDSFQQEFKKTIPQKDPAFFRRHESFNVGPSFLGGSRHERQDATKWRPYFVAERFSHDGTSYASFQRQISEVSDSVVSSVPNEEEEEEDENDDDDDDDDVDDDDEKKLSDEHFIEQETTYTLIVDQISNHVESGSESNEDDVGYVDIEKVVKQDFEHDVSEIATEDLENHHERDISMVDLREMGEIHVNNETDDEESNTSSSSSSSSSSLADDEINTNLKDDDPSDITTLDHSSIEEESNLNIANTNVDDHIQIEDPVYDSSPSATDKIISFNSISSEILEDVVVEPEIGSPSKSNIVHESGDRSITSAGHDHASAFEQDHDDLNESNGVVKISKDLSSSSSDDESVNGNVINNDGNFQQEQRELKFEMENWVSENSSYQSMRSEDSPLSVEHEHQHPPLMAENASEELSSPVSEYTEEISDKKDQTLPVEHDQVQSSNHDANIVLTREDISSEVKPSSSEEKESISYEPEPSFSDHKEQQEPSVTEAKYIQEVRITDNVNLSKIHDPDEFFTPHFRHLSPDPTFFPSGYTKGSFFNSVENENISDTDDMEAIEEDLLSELDAVGDFSVVKDSGSNFNEIQTCPVEVEENFNAGNDSVEKIKGEKVDDEKIVGTGPGSSYEDQELREVNVPILEKDLHFKAEATFVENHFEKKLISWDFKEELVEIETEKTEENGSSHVEELRVQETTANSSESSLHKDSKEGKKVKSHKSSSSSSSGSSSSDSE